MLTVIAMVMLSSAVLIGITSPPGASIWNLLLGLAFTSLFTGSVTAIVFTTLASREAEQVLDVALDHVLSRVFVPLRSVTDENALHNYQWLTHLTLPPNDDKHPTLGVQLIRFSYTREALPSVVSIVCLASMDDNALQPFMDTGRYLTRWQIDSDLDPSDQTIFSLGFVSVNGTVLVPSVKNSVDDGVALCEYKYSVPKHLRNGRVKVDISIVTRSELTDTHVPITVNLFSHVTEAMFSCTVDSSIECKRLSVGTNVTALGPRGESWSGSTYVAPYSALAAHVRYNHPLQAGSAVTFYIDR